MPELEVQVRGLPQWQGEPDLCEVTYPDGTIYGLTRVTVERLFTVVSPQTIMLGGKGGGRYDRPLPAQIAMPEKML